MKLLRRTLDPKVEVSDVDHTTVGHPSWASWGLTIMTQRQIRHHDAKPVWKIDWSITFWPLWQRWKLLIAPHRFLFLILSINDLLLEVRPIIFVINWSIRLLRYFAPFSSSASASDVIVRDHLRVMSVKTHPDRGILGNFLGLNNLNEHSETALPFTQPINLRGTRGTDAFLSLLGSETPIRFPPSPKPIDVWDLVSETLAFW